ncbi:MAG: hypothetical protein K1060chlam2_00078 [Chlamydiae bacterium]|nr:hypothetical protein [Chlamydiota bacterium]
MSYWIFLPFLLQALLIGVDEFVFHVKRGLPKWEKIGHPADTLSVILCFLFILWVPYSPGAVKVFIGLAIFSCLMVTKDEFIHKHHCPASENWLHAVLFVLHPIVLALAGIVWAASFAVAPPQWISPFLTNPSTLRTALITQTLLLSLFFSYQVIFWNVIWREKPVLKY